MDGRGGSCAFSTDVQLSNGNDSYAWTPNSDVQAILKKLLSVVASEELPAIVWDIYPGWGCGRRWSPGRPSTSKRLPKVCMPGGWPRRSVSSANTQLRMQRLLFTRIGRQAGRWASIQAGRPGRKAGRQRGRQTGRSTVAAGQKGSMALSD